MTGHLQELGDVLPQSANLGIPSLGHHRSFRIFARWCPSSLDKLVNITPIKPMVKMADTTIVFMGFINQLITGGAPSCGMSKKKKKRRLAESGTMMNDDYSHQPGL